MNFFATLHFFLEVFCLAILWLQKVVYSSLHYVRYRKDSLSTRVPGYFLGSTSPGRQPLQKKFVVCYRLPSNLLSIKSI